MEVKIESQFREPTAFERALLARLLEANFPGKSELTALLRDVLVRTIDEDGGLQLESRINGQAPVVKRVPVEAQGKDEDGAIVHMLLHVDEGRPVKLEFFREDAVTVKVIPPPSNFELMVMPAAPKDGWVGRDS